MCIRDRFIIDIFSELLKHFPNLKLTIVGDGLEKNNIINYIEKLHLSKKISVLDYSENVLSIMKTFDIFILTSKYEGIPLTIMDSLALGIPVVASKVGSIPEIVKNGFNGFTLELKNINGFVDTIINILNNRNLHEYLSSNAIKSVQNFTVEKMVKEYENLYLRLLNKP
ncbi:MAG: glycosyltransferase, partial [Ignavibacteria bacterium]|nr:glycosyltransferase [Ignavibacteria bacterium]